MTKTITVTCSLEKFKDRTGYEIPYLKLTAEVLGVTIRLKPSDSTTAQILKTYLASNKQTVWGALSPTIKK